MAGRRLANSVHRHPGLAAGLVALGLACGSQIALPSPASDLVFAAVATAGVLAAMIGPLVIRPPVRGPYRWLVGGASCFLASEGVRIYVTVTTPGARPPAGLAWLVNDADPWAFAGYGCIAAFLLSLLRVARGHADRFALHDTAVISLGTALALWSVQVAPALQTGRTNASSPVTAAVYPLMDVIILALTVRLALLATRRGPALWALLVAMSGLLTGDVIYGEFQMSMTSAPYRWVRALYMIGFGLVGVVGAHPSSRWLAAPGQRRVGRIPSARRAMIVVALLIPCGLSQFMPTYGVQDRAARLVLLVALLLVVVLRLINTVLALGDAEQASHLQATHDRLTGLPNRTALIDGVTALLDTGPASC
jgi:hypothetical protein